MPFLNKMQLGIYSIAAFLCRTFLKFGMILDIKNLTKKIRNTLILKDISFNIGDNDIVGFIGPNGAGKSATLKSKQYLRVLFFCEIKIIMICVKLLDNC